MVKWPWLRTRVIFPFVFGFVTIVLYQNCGKDPFTPKPIARNLSSIGDSGSNSIVSGLQIKMGMIRGTAVGVAAGLAIEGPMMMVQDPVAGTKVYLQAIGLAPNTTTYVSHVHDQSCTIGGGGHYKFDYGITTAIQSNEIWPAFTYGTDGVAHGFASVQHYARPEAQALVLHAADNTRLACGLFYPQGGVTQKAGLFANLAGGTGQNRTITGSGVLIRNGWAGQTILKLSVSGLAMNTTYMAHVHNQACANQEGGAHYKTNASVTETVATAANEIWATIATGATGAATSRTVVNGHVARTDAMSVVIHDSANMATRLACVDLATDGGVQSTVTGLDRTRNITGTSKIERLSSGQTKVTLALAGLAANTRYMSHVHDRPCHIAAGGGHYKLDPTNPATIESNEIWVAVQADAQGAGTGTITVNHLARPEAQSIVVHDPADASRLACVDMY